VVVCFFLKEACNPTTCDRCHLGPDHPQIEVWEEYQRLIELGKSDPVPYLPGAVFEKGPNLRPGIDVPDLRKLEKKK
jgi:hypothetical protein